MAKAMKKTTVGHNGIPDAEKIKAMADELAPLKADALAASQAASKAKKRLNDRRKKLAGDNGINLKWFDAAVEIIELENSDARHEAASQFIGCLSALDDDGQFDWVKSLDSLAASATKKPAAAAAASPII